MFCHKGEVLIGEVLATYSFAGEFEAVYKNAVPLIRCGIKEGNNGASIPLTILAVQKTNNVRLFPANVSQTFKKLINILILVPIGRQQRF